MKTGVITEQGDLGLGFNEVSPEEEEALREMWSTRTLHRNITSQYYFRLLQSPAKENVKEEMHRMAEANKAFAHYRW